MIAFISWRSKIIEDNIRELLFLINNFETSLIYIVPQKPKFEEIKKDNIDKIENKIKNINKEIYEFNKFLAGNKKFCEFEEIKEINIPTIKSILESENIPFLAQGDHVSTTLAHGMTVRFLVPLKFLEKAKQALKDFL